MSNLQDLLDRPKRFRAENAENQAPIQWMLRLDAEFGTEANIALLIETGYELYSHPYGTRLSGKPNQQTQAVGEAWQRVGSNTEMIAWKALPISDFPYPLDLAREEIFTLLAANFIRFA